MKQETSNRSRGYVSRVRVQGLGFGAAETGDSKKV
jgi:hypothetical protein